MKTNPALLTMALALAVSLLAVETRAGGTIRNEYSEGSRGGTRLPRLRTPSRASPIVPSRSLRTRIAATTFLATERPKEARRTTRTNQGKGTSSIRPANKHRMQAEPK